MNALARLRKVLETARAEALARFGTVPSLLRIGAWSVLFFVLILHASSLRTPAQPSLGNRAVLEEIRNEVVLRSDRIHAREGLLDAVPPKGAGAFRIGIIGASEDFNRYERDTHSYASMSWSFVNTVPPSANDQAVIRDFSFPGMTLQTRYYHILESIEMDLDLLIVTFSLGGLYADLRSASEVVEPVGPAEEVGHPAAFNRMLALARPSSELDDFLGRHFRSYQERFAHTLAPIFNPDNVLLITEFVNQEALIAKYRKEIRTSNIPGMERFFAEDRARIETFFARIARPANEHGIPMFFMLTPLDRSILTGEEVQRLAAIDRALNALQPETAEYQIWSAFALDIFAKDQFRDPVHLADFRPSARALLEQLRNRGLVPEEWEVIDETQNP